MAIDLGGLKPGADWKELGRNVLGEMQMAVLLRRQGGASAAAGWDGDRYAVFEGPRNRLGLVWLTTWDSEDDAREFTTAYRPVPDRASSATSPSRRERSTTRSGATSATSSTSSSAGGWTSR